jgi:hypothetical protein
MNKREIKKFIEELREDALVKSNQQYTEDLHEEFKQVALEATKDVDMVALLTAIETIRFEVSKIKDFYDDDKRNKKYVKIYGTDISYLNNHASRILNYKDDVIEDLVKNCSRNGNTKLKSVQAKEERNSKIRDQFNKILGNISTMKADDALGYLLNIGIAMPKPDERVVNEILAPVDVEFIRSLQAQVNPVGTDDLNSDWKDNVEE